MNTRHLLLILERVEDVDVAKLLLGALGEFAPFILFGNADVFQHFGACSYPFTFDAIACAQSPDSFAAVLSLAELDATTPSRFELLMRYFAEIGVPALSVQRELFQAGFAVADVQLAPLGVPTLPPVQGVQLARKYLSFAGENGIGYVRAALLPPSSRPRPELVLVTSAFDWLAYPERERYQFALAVLELAKAHPTQQLVWRPRPSELLRGQPTGALAMVVDHKLSNLTIERAESIETLMQTCGSAISMLAPNVLDHQFTKMPTALFVGDMLRQAARVLGCSPFSTREELLTLWPKLIAQPEQHFVHSQIPAFNSAKLVAQVTSSCAVRALRSDWSACAERFVATELIRAEVMRLTQQQQQLEAHVTHTLGKLMERIGVLQRSSIAYKAKRLWSKLSP